MATPAATRPQRPDRCCADAWSAATDEHGAAAILYAIESGQPEISLTKLCGLVEHYGFEEGSPATAYFELHAERDHAHAEQSKAVLEHANRLDDDRLVAAAEAALIGNWNLLDGVERTNVPA